MIEFKMSLADVGIAVSCNFDSTKIYCKDYLFDGKCRYQVSIRQEDIEFERENDEFHASDAFLETLSLLRKCADLLIDEDVLLFHSSALEMDGKAYIFTARSGTGKSTHSRMWREFFSDRQIHMVNDDKPFVKIKDDIMVYGDPWKGKELLGENRKAPVKAICFLKQGKVNKIQKMDEKRVLEKLMMQTYRPVDKKKLIKTITLLKKMTSRIPVYEMSCTISHDAAKMAYEYMNEE